MIKGIKVLLFLIFTLNNFIKCDDEDKTVILSTKNVQNLNSSQLLTPLRKYDPDISIIASVNGIIHPVIPLFYHIIVILLLYYCYIITI